MRRKQIFSLALLILAAAVMLSAGVLQVYRVYQHYRADILSNESRHLESIVGTSASNLDWMLAGYDAQLAMTVSRPEFAEAEQSYRETEDVAVLKLLLARREVLRAEMRYSVAIWDAGQLLAATTAAYPADAAADEALGELCVLRKDGADRFWFVFSRASESGLRYELAVQVKTLFNYQAEYARVGQRGYFFLMDRDLRMIYWSNGETDGHGVISDLMGRNGSLDGEALEELARGVKTDYYVFHYPWQDGTDQALVVTRPVLGSDRALIVGSAMSFEEFNSFLADTMKHIGWIILMVMAGGVILFAVAAWVIVKNRRSAMELDVVKERADLMEEVNRQQQSLYHTERLQQLGVMTSGMVHEFNNLLTPMMGQSLLLLEDLADRDGTPEFECALDIYEASEKAREVLRRMSFMSKKDVDLGFKTLELGGLLRKTMNLSAMAKDPHVTQELTVPEGPVFICGNEQLLTQAFLNLCINACQAMGQEGALTVSAGTVSRSGQDYAVVRVSDTGPGIPAGILKSLYEPFVTTKGEKGTGLGLSICKKIIESHKGTIVAENRPEGGAVFTVQIPLTEPETED